MPNPYRYRPTATHTKKHAPRSKEPIALRDCLTGQRYELGAATRELLLGGSTACDITITDPCASAKHCSLRRIGGRWIVRDLDSKNGTKINGTRIRLAEVRGGNYIVIGDTRLEILAKEETEKIRRGLIGSSPNFLLAVERALRAARTQCPVLILGETGTGKELIARTIHAASRRSEHPFVPVNCGAIPVNLVRSELFGHAKGSFTGATEQHDGHFSQAHGGTIFLDELGELPLEQQPHLLRALESGLIRRVGGKHEELVNTRFVSATNRDCLDLKTSPLRNDLFHRLSTVIIDLPPLRERVQDIPVLLRHFLDQNVDEFGTRVLGKNTLYELSRHSWGGNIRELRNCVSRALTLGAHRLYTHDFLPDGVVPHTHSPKQTPAPNEVAADLSGFERNQRELIMGAYQRSGTIRSAALELGIPKSTFADMCKRYAIDTRRRRRIKL